jgi:photosystem I subunit X
LLNLTLLAALPVIPSTSEWSPGVGLVMITCNLFAFVIGRFAIKNPGQGPDLPVDKPSILSGFGYPELLATASFGHILGAGLILGLSSAGLL